MQQKPPAKKLIRKKNSKSTHQLHKSQRKAVAAAPNGLTCQEHMLERLMPGHTQSMSTQRYGHTWEICEMSEAMPGASCNQSFPTNSTLQCPAKKCKKCLRRVTVMCAAHKVDAKENCVKSHFQNSFIVDHSLSHNKLKDLVPNCQKLPVTHSYQYSPLGLHCRICGRDLRKAVKSEDGRTLRNTLMQSQEV